MLIIRPPLGTHASTTLTSHWEFRSRPKELYSLLIASFALTLPYLAKAVAPSTPLCLGSLATDLKATLTIFYSLTNYYEPCFT